MSRLAKILFKVLSGTSDTNISFQEIVPLLEALEFKSRIRGSHHIYTHHAIPEILNLQSHHHQAKPYQVKQIRTIITRYQLGRNLYE